MKAIFDVPLAVVRRGRIRHWIRLVEHHVGAKADRCSVPPEYMQPSPVPDSMLPDGSGGIVVGIGALKIFVAANSDPAYLELSVAGDAQIQGLWRPAFALAMDVLPVASYGQMTRRTFADLTPEPGFLRRPGRDVVFKLWTRDEILERFTDLDAFLACWDGYEQHEDRYLVHVGLELEDAQAFATHVRESLWRLARIVKPGYFTYYAMNPQDWEQEWWASHPSHLQFVLVDRHGVAEFSSAAGPSEELAPRDISAVRDAFRTRTAPDGTPCTAVRVVFAHEEAARRERVPLMDCGAHVYYLDGSMELQLVGEPSATAVPKRWVHVGSLR